MSSNSDFFEQQLTESRAYLLKFARLQLRNDSCAEDAVSETLLAALAKPQAFAARSQLRTWLVGILKHKIVDMLRQHGRDRSSQNSQAGDRRSKSSHIQLPSSHFVACNGQPRWRGNRFKFLQFD